MSTLPDGVNEENAFWRQVHADKQKRHDDHLQLALSVLGEIENWAAECGVAVKLTNASQHWQFTLPSGVLVNWWPSTGKMLVDRRDGKQPSSWRAWDWEHLCRRLEKMLRGGAK